MNETVIVPGCHGNHIGTSLASHGKIVPQSTAQAALPERALVTEQPYNGNIQPTGMGPDGMDPVVLEIMAVLDSLFLAERQARFQVSALEVQDYPLAATFEMVRDTESDAAIEEALSGFGFEQHTLDDDAELWISDELGLMVSLLLHRTGWPLLHLQDNQVRGGRRG